MSRTHPWRTKNHAGYLASTADSRAHREKRAYEARNVAPRHPAAIINDRKGPSQR